MPALRFFLSLALTLGFACPLHAQDAQPPDAPATDVPADASADAPADTAATPDATSADATSDVQADATAASPNTAGATSETSADAPSAESPSADATEASEASDASEAPVAPEPSESSEPTGGLRVVGNPSGARVFVDDREVGRLPYEGRASPGTHRVRVEDLHQKTWYGVVEVEANQLARVRVHLYPETDRGSGWATLVIGALFLGGGITTAVLTNELAGELALQRDLGTLSTDDPRLDRGLFMAIGADAGFGLALIFCALSLYYLVYESHPPSEGRVLEARPLALSPYLDPVRGAGGLALAGAF